MPNADDFISERLKQREGQHLLRSLSNETNLIDFCSNDYLGFAQSDELKKLISVESTKNQDQPIGSTGSRLITGNTSFAENLESEIASYHQAQAGLLYNSGYDANLGLFSCLPQRGDTIITDELIHASIIDGCRLSYANRYTFKHNDLHSLREKLAAAKGNIFIGVESIYSMDGDEAPLVELATLAEEFGAALIVDEAHATGIYGMQGRGLVNKYGLEKRVFARIITFGKALGCHGAIILGGDQLRSYLVNFSRPFIYSTAAPFHSYLNIKMAYQYMEMYNHQDKLIGVIARFKDLVEPIASKFIPSNSAIQSMVVGGNIETREMAARLKTAGYDIKAILSPTVPEGKERLRICLHSFNTEEQLKGLVENLMMIV